MIVPWCDVHNERADLLYYGERCRSGYVEMQRMPGLVGRRNCIVRVRIIELEDTDAIS